MPVGIDGLDFAGAVECCNLPGSEIPPFCGQILAKLLFVAGPDDDGRNGRALEEPVQGHLWNGLARLSRDAVQSVDDVVEIFVGDLRALLGGLVEAADFGQRMSAANLAGEASPTEGTPDQGADFLV